MKLEIGTRLDTRDEFGKWLVGEIVKFEDGVVEIAFDGWDERWNEKIRVISSESLTRMAPLHAFTTSGIEEWILEQSPEVFVLVDGEWRATRIIRVDGLQVQVSWDPNGTKPKQKWFHLENQEVMFKSLDDVQTFVDLLLESPTTQKVCGARKARSVYEEFRMRCAEVEMELENFLE